MLKLIRFTTAAFLLFIITGHASAVTITIDMNGFANNPNGQVTGTALKDPIPLPAGKDKVELPGLTAAGTYGVDFFHNSGPLSSDFSFTVNDEGTGVASVTLGGEKYEMVAGFKPGDKTLKLNTHEIIYNANSGQTGVYYVPGPMAAYSVEAGSGAQKLIVVPGMYHVDNLYNTNGGKEDYNFLVDNKGKVSPASDDDAEYADFKDASVSPRSVRVHFKIEATQPINYNPYHPVQNQVNTGNVYELDMQMPVGGSGINVWTFGASKVVRSDSVTPDDKPLEGAEAENDFNFNPRLHYDLKKKSYYFQTTHGPAQTVMGEAGGTVDGGAQNLTATVTATIEKNDAPGAATAVAPAPAK